MKTFPLNPLPFVVVAVVLMSSGCATRAYVQKQIDPVACKADVLVTKSAALEEKANSLEARIAILEEQVTQAQLANKTMLDEATARAADSAQRAETAAAAADASAQRAEKIFELNQKK